MSSLLLRKLAVCPACKNICKDPHTLPPCGHTICKGCTGLDSNELTLKCPVCDHMCDRSEITLDEPMSAFLEKVEQQRSQRNQNEDTGTFDWCTLRIKHVKSVIDCNKCLGIFYEEMLRKLRGVTWGRKMQHGLRRYYIETKWCESSLLIYPAIKVLLSKHDVY